MEGILLEWTSGTNSVGALANRAAEVEADPEFLQMEPRSLDGDAI